MVALVLLLVGVAAWVLATESGARWLFGRLPLPPELTYLRVEGTVWGGLEFHDAGYRDDSLQLSMARVGFRLAPADGFAGVVVREARLDDVVVLLLDREDDQETDSEPFDLADLAAPIPIVVEDLRLARLDIEDGSGERTRVLDRATLSGRWDDALRGVDLEAAAEGAHLAVAGGFELAGGETDLEALLSLDGSRWDERLPEDLVVRLRMQDDIDRALVELGSDAVGLEGAGTVEGLPAAPALQLSFSVGEWSVPLDEGPPLSLTDVRGQVEADMTVVRVDLAGQAVGGGFAPEAAFDWSFRGDLEESGFSIALARVAAGAGEARAKGRIDWNGDSAPVNLEIEWRDLQWPLTGDEALVTSGQGGGRLEGVLDDWRFSGRFGLESSAYPGGEVAVEAEGGTRNANLRSIEANVLGGTATGSATLSWDPDPAGEAALELAGVDLGVLFPDWPARIDSRFQLVATGGSAPAAELHLERLDGRFMGEALTGTGRFAWREGAWIVDDANLALGPASAAVDGEWSADALAGRLEMDTGGRGWVARQVGGALRGHIAIDSRRPFPVADADLVGADIGHGGVRLESLAIRSAPGSERLDLQVGGLSIDGTAIGDVVTSLAASSGGYRLDAALTGEVIQLETQIDGAVAADASLLQPAFEGRLTRLRLSGGEDRVMTLQAPAELVMGTEQIMLSRACFAFGPEGAACASVDVTPGAAAALEGDLDDVPLNTLVMALAPDSDLELTHRASGTFSGAWRRGERPASVVAIDLGAGRLGMAGERPGVETAPGFVGFELDTGALRNGKVDIPLVNGGRVGANFDIEGVEFDGTGRLTGAVDLRLPDLGFVGDVLAPLDNVSGGLRSRLVLGGTVGDPQFDGGFDLSDLRFDLPQLGTSVTDMDLRGRVNRTDRLSLRGQYAMGAGEGTVAVDAGFADIQRPELRVRVDGETLELVNLPDLEVVANPAFALAWREGAWNVQGRVDVPRLLVSPQSSFVTRVDESDDVVVVAGERTPVLERRSEQPAELFGTLAVALGDEVRLEADIASLALSGSADLVWDGALVPRATGEVLLDGPVTVWGPRLMVERGRVRWDEAPVGNPALDIKAERDVFGSSLVRTAGVRVSGTARRPDVEAYTRPLTTSERAWALLLTGSDVDYAEGVGGFDVGTYIAPRLFLSYGISLFDSENVVGLRYDLRRGWGIKATSGQRESGIDISYTVEQ